MPLKVVSTAPLPADAVRRFFGDAAGAGDVEVVVVEPRTEAAAAGAVAGADIVIGDYSFEVPITAAVIERMDRCRLIQQPSAGYQQIDIEAAAARGIPVCNVGGANDVAVAEHTVMVVLALLKQLRWLDAETRDGRWRQHDVIGRGHYELAGKRWGIVGFGRIGRRVARRLDGWDVDVCYYDVVRSDTPVEYRDLDGLLAESDVVSLHTPLTRDTHHLIDGAALARMKRTAVLVNVARGEIVDEDALAVALRDGALLGAALDVFATEPLPAGSPFADLPNVLLTPHTAGTPIEARIRIMQMTGANLRRLVAGEPLVDVVNGMRA